MDILYAKEEPRDPLVKAAIQIWLHQMQIIWKVGKI
jgi:hypothetical protein